MKNSILKLVKWFCSKVSLNELASAMLIFNEALSKVRLDIPFKKTEKPLHYRAFKTDTCPPLPKPELTKFQNKPIWRELKQKAELKTGKIIKPVKKRKNQNIPKDCLCNACGAPIKYLYLNNGKKQSQVKCKICGKTSPTHNIRRESKTKYFCPYCFAALFQWKKNTTTTTYKCPNQQCSHFLKNKTNLTKEETEMRDKQKYNPNFKLHYQFREYHITKQDLKTAQPSEAFLKLNNIRNSHNILGLILTFTINCGLSARATKTALKDLFGIKISHQTIINYINSAASVLAPFVDKNSPAPKSTSAADETYIIVNGIWHYTWFIIDAQTRAICSYNLSTTRSVQPALALIYNCFGKLPLPDFVRKLITDGNPSYDAAVLAFNHSITNGYKLQKNTVIGLKNLDPESEEYRSFKQIIERLNRTYKFHTRPRAGFKSFNGAVCLTTLFVAYYNFLRLHPYTKNQAPVHLDCLNNLNLMPQKWITLLKQAA